MKNFCAALSIIGSLFLAFTAGASEEKISVMSQYPVAAPNGQEVAFAADFDGTSRIWISSLDGSGLRSVSSDQQSSAAHIEPAWSPDGQRIAYTSVFEGASDIWVMQANGWYPQRLTANGASNTHPIWLSDGRRIVFVSDKDGSADLWVMNADGSHAMKLVNSSAQENSPTLSPLGDQIAFSSTDGDKATLMITDMNGSVLRTLTAGRYRDWEPAWGQRGIVFSSDRDGSGRWKIWTIQADGSNLRKVGDFTGHDPSWLPDGRILFTEESESSKAMSAISLLNPADGTKRVVVDVQGYLTPIDVRPGKIPNQINPKSSGRIRVAILSTRTLDVTKSIVKDSITWGRTGAERTQSDCRQISDLNNDGRPDLLCRFSLAHAGFRMGDTLSVLRFTDTRGVSYEGRDAIVTVTYDNPDDFKD